MTASLGERVGRQDVVDGHGRAALAACWAPTCCHAEYAEDRTRRRRCKTDGQMVTSELGRATWSDTTPRAAPLQNDYARQGVCNMTEKGLNVFCRHA